MPLVLCCWNQVQNGFSRGEGLRGMGLVVKLACVSASCLQSTFVLGTYLKVHTGGSTLSVGSTSTDLKIYSANSHAPQLGLDAFLRPTEAAHCI